MVFDGRELREDGGWRLLWLSMKGGIEKFGGFQYFRFSCGIYT